VDVHYLVHELTNHFQCKFFPMSAIVVKLFLYSKIFDYLGSSQTNARFIGIRQHHHSKINNAACRIKLYTRTPSTFSQYQLNGRADALVTMNINNFKPASHFGLPVLLPGVNRLHLTLGWLLVRMLNRLRGMSYRHSDFQSLARLATR
jgi:hypothetical protein